MFKTREDIVTALLALDIAPHEGGEASAPESDQQKGWLTRLKERASRGDDVQSPVHFRREMAEALATLAKPTAHLRSLGQPGKAPLGSTRIGGAPDLPPDVEWPIRPAMPDIAKRHGEPSGSKFDDIDLSFLDDIKDEDGKSLTDFVTPEMKAAFDAAGEATNETLAEFYAAPGPLPFLAQISFAQLSQEGALAGQPDMPTSGILYVFFDLIEQPWGFDPKDEWGSKLIWHDGATDVLERRTLPEALTKLEEDESASAVPVTHKLSATPGFAFPDTIDQNIYALPSLAEEEDDGMREWICDYHEALEPDHRVGGWPAVVQNPMEVECALVTAGKCCGDGDAFSDPANAAIRATAKDWVLLLQIDSDPKAEFMFGDSGRLYVWIKRDDLAARAFEQAWVVLQCY